MRRLDQPAGVAEQPGDTHLLEFKVLFLEATVLVRQPRVAQLRAGASVGELQRGGRGPHEHVLVGWRAHACAVAHVDDTETQRERTGAAEAK